MFAFVVLAWFSFFQYHSKLLAGKVISRVTRFYVKWDMKPWMKQSL